VPLAICGERNSSASVAVRPPRCQAILRSMPESSPNCGKRGAWVGGTGRVAGLESGAENSWVDDATEDGVRPIRLKSSDQTFSDTVIRAPKNVCHNGGLLSHLTKGIGK
jgi:hypothetical protein